MRVRTLLQLGVSFARRLAAGGRCRLLLGRMDSTYNYDLDSNYTPSSFRSSAPSRSGARRGPTDLEWLFSELDADSSGHISRTELEAAILQIYGQPLDPALLDSMMKDADSDGDGEISLTEFKKMMYVASKQRGSRSRDSRSKSMWFKVKDRGPSRLVKASLEMQKRRETFTKQRFAKVHHALDEMFNSHPEYWKAKSSLLPSLEPAPSSGPAPLPLGGGLPPRAQAQLGAKGKKARLNRSPGFAKRKKKVDLEAGENGNAGDQEPEEQDFATWVSQTLASISMSCLVSSFVEAVDLAVSIGPLLVALLLPASWIFNEIRDLVNAYYAEPGAVAPPPPPSAPDMAGKMHELELGFYDFAQEHPAEYLAVDLGLGFGIGALALFWKDINDFFERRALEAAAAAKAKEASKAGYRKLEGDTDDSRPQPRARRRGGLNHVAMQTQLKAAAAKQTLSPKQMRMELTKSITTIERVCTTLGTNL